jgi:hypothetical protein
MFHARIGYVVLFLESKQHIQVMATFRLAADTVAKRLYHRQRG